MAFQLNEKMMAHDRAIITRNKVEKDLLGTDLIKFKPGMIHYVSDTQKLFLSVEPKKVNGKQTRAFVEIMTEDKGVDIILQDKEPTNITNENTYWYEIV